MQPTTDDNNDSDEMWSTVESGAGGEDGAAPCSRGKHSATLLGGHVYVLGGRGAGGSVPLRDFWRYSLASGVWERLECSGEPPPSLQEHTATAHEGKLYVFGGEAGALSTETPLWIYDTETHVWRKLPGQSVGSSVRRRVARDSRAAPATSPRGRRGHSAHALKDCLLIYGGYKDLRGSTNELWAFHYETESWQAVRTVSAGPARHRHAAALHDNKLYVHGGMCDLRDTTDLYHYHTISRVWTCVRGAGKCSPGARSGHAAVRAGSHLYIFGGETQGHSSNDMWRFHFASECWERIVGSVRWPPPRVDGRALLVCGAVPAQPWLPAPAAPEPPARRARLASFHLRRNARCSYTALADKDSTESLVRQEAALAKSQSSYTMCRGDGELAREPVSVPDFTDVSSRPTVHTDTDTKLVYLDSEEEEETRRGRGRVTALPKSASVRFTRDALAADEEDAELSTSDYASAERVNRLSGASLGFSNPHYLGPDVRKLRAALTPDSGLGANDIEMKELGPSARGGTETGARQGAQLHLLLVGGKEPPHVALLRSPLSMWTYRLL